ncbi:MAG TPA: hypothetical protein VF911_05815, partial [Thermoanaerobaculia bacterium]
MLRDWEKFAPRDYRRLVERRALARRFMLGGLKPAAPPERRYWGWRHVLVCCTTEEIRALRLPSFSGAAGFSPPV